MQIKDIFHNCPEQQEQQKQSDPKDLGSKFPRSKMCGWMDFYLGLKSVVACTDCLKSAYSA